MQYRSGLSALLLSLLAAACSGGDDGYTPPTPTATSLAFVTQPVGGVEGSPLATQPVVEVRDQDGDRLAGSTLAVTVALGANPAGGTLGGTRTVNAVDGRATFTNLTLDEAGAGYTLVASAASVTGATSSAFTITAATPATPRLVFTTQPVSGEAGLALTTQPVVQIQDQGGALLTTRTDPITIVIGTNPGTATLGGTATVNAVAGVATFTGLSVSAPGNGYTLVASTAAATAGTSSAFNVAAITRSVAVVSGNNQTGAPSAALAQPIRVRVTRTQGGAAQAGITVTFAVTAGGGSVTPTTVTTDANGDAQATWTLGAAGAQTATASVSGATTPASFSATVQLAGFQLASVSPSMDFSTGGSQNFTCGVTADGRAFCWGNNQFGMLGNGSTTSSTRPVQVTGSGTGNLVLRSIASGVSHVCALNDQGAAFCWGENGFGKLGRGDAFAATLTTPNAVVGGFVFSQIDVGVNFSCGIIAAGQANAGRIVCWGVVATFNSSGSPQLLPGTRLYSRIALGRNYGCGLVAAGQPEAGQAFCWGINVFGQLGIGGAIDPDFSTAEPVAVSGGRTWIDIAAGDFDHTCGITTEGTSFCWGLNQTGQLGEGTQGTNRTAPVQVQGVPLLSRITTGSGWTCGIVAAGQAGAGQGRCWGFNQQGQAGTGAPTTANVLTPTAVASNLVYTAIAAGGNNTCGTTANGTFCWGANQGGSIGDGTIGNPGINNDPNNAKGSPSPVAQP